MTDNEIDQILIRCMENTEPRETIDPALIAKAKAAILPSLRSVRPLAPTWAWVAAFLLIAGCIVALGGVVLGMYGFHVLTPGQRLLIFCVVGLYAGITAHGVAREMAPGSKHRIHAWGMLLLSGVSFSLLFGLLFKEYGADNFVGAGIRCLATAVGFAIATALVLIPFLRRGFFVNSAAGGIATGTFAGLAGIAVLELHCPNLSVPHVLMWHVGVLVVSGVAGWLAGHAVVRQG